MKKSFLNLIFNIFMARFRHGIGECLLMACLGHVGSLKSN